MEAGDPPAQEGERIRHRLEVEFGSRRQWCDGVSLTARPPMRRHRQPLGAQALALRPNSQSRAAPNRARLRDSGPMNDALDPIFTLATSSELLPARSQMAFTLGFHIILACLGVAFPALMLIANYIGLKRDDEVALGLARRWSKVAAVTLRGRRRHRHRALVRVRAPVAGVHRPLRRRLRDPVRDRGDLLLPRGDLHRDLHLRLEPAVAAGRTSGPGSRSRSAGSAAPTRWSASTPG